jgi:nuclear cap-binding protein subunit 1
MQVDVCKLMQTFPRGMSACVRESFARMEVMDPLLRSRLSRWLAYHLSNFDFMWPWDKWKHVLTAPAHDAQRYGALAACKSTSGTLVPLQRAQLL